MQYEGVLTKMQSSLSDRLRYYINFDSDFILVNSLINRNIQLHFVGFKCLNCCQEIKIFRQGFCYNCYYKSASAGQWIMRPELSTAHLDIEDRDLAYEKKVQLQPHIVYLSYTGGFKIGVTRKTQIPTRWIDQGAVAAYCVVEVPNRYLAGVGEVHLKNFFADKTNWRKMLQKVENPTDIFEKIKEVENQLPSELLPYVLKNQTPVFIDYPVVDYPEKIKSLNLEKEEYFKGKLIGIKGQYLLFEDGTVFNVRNHEGLVVRLTIE